MKRKDMMPIAADQALVWTLRPSRRLVRMQLPDLPIAGLPEPLRVVMDFDALTVDAIIERLSLLRTQMLPKRTRQTSGGRRSFAQAARHQHGDRGCRCGPVKRFYGRPIT
jgi:hypothetical protein